MGLETSATPTRVEGGATKRPTAVTALYRNCAEPPKTLAGGARTTMAEYAGGVPLPTPVIVGFAMPIVTVATDEGGAVVAVLVTVTEVETTVTTAVKFPEEKIAVAERVLIPADTVTLPVNVGVVVAPAADRRGWVEVSPTEAVKIGAVVVPLAVRMVEGQVAVIVAV